MMFPAELEGGAFRSGNGEYGWSRAQIPTVVEILRTENLAILGGEVWWVPEGARDWEGLIPQRSGPPVVYTWETKHDAEESWADFVTKAGAEAESAVQRWPKPEDLRPNLPGRVLYNLTWVSQHEFEQLKAGSD